MMVIRRAAPLIALFAGALAASLVEGLPDDLPGVALGSAAHALEGRLPTQLSTAGLAYEPYARPSVQELQSQVARIESTVLRLTARLDEHLRED